MKVITWDGIPDIKTNVNGKEETVRSVAHPMTSHILHVSSHIKHRPSSSSCRWSSGEETHSGMITVRSRGCRRPVVRGGGGGGREELGCCWRCSYCWASGCTSRILLQLLALSCFWRAPGATVEARRLSSGGDRYRPGHFRRQAWKTASGGYRVPPTPSTTDDEVEPSRSSQHIYHGSLVFIE